MPSEAGRQLITALENEIEYINQLNKLLVQEKEVLVQNKLEELESIADQKDKLSQKLETSAKKRMELISRNNHHNTEQALSAFFTQCPADEIDTIKILNKELKKNLDNCCQLNMINGQVIVSNLNTRKELVNILQGHPNNASDVYNSTGGLANKPGGQRHEEA